MSTFDQDPATDPVPIIHVPGVLEASILGSEVKRLRADIERLRARGEYMRSQWTGALSNLFIELNGDINREQAIAKAEARISQALATWDRIDARDRAHGLTGVVLSENEARAFERIAGIGPDSV